MIEVKFPPEDDQNEKKYTVVLPESQARAIHKLVQDYLIEHQTPGEYGWQLCSGEVSLTRQLFNEQGMLPPDEDDNA